MQAKKDSLKKKGWGEEGLDGKGGENIEEDD